MLGALALYILRTEKIENDTLLLAIWDYLRTAFSRILSGRHLSDARPLALIVSSVVCHALLKVATYNTVVGGFLILSVRRSQLNLPSERFTSSSPWTLSLASAVEMLLKAQISGDDYYTTALRNELQRGGAMLLSRTVGQAGARQERVVCNSFQRMRPDIQLYPRSQKDRVFDWYTAEGSEAWSRNAFMKSSLIGATDVTDLIWKYLIDAPQ